MTLTPAMVQELRYLENQGGGLLRTEAVVTLARDPTSALHAHPAFEWDVEKAAYRQWMDAARSVVQVYVGVVDDGDERRTMRQYVHVFDADKNPVYRSTQRVLQENRATVIGLVCDRIVSAIKSYPLSEFDPVLELVEQIRAAATRPRPRPRPRPGARGRRGGEARV